MAQWNKTTQDYLNQERSLHEVYIRADQYGKLMNDGASSRSAFGELLSVTPTPVIQLDGLYGFDPNKTERYTNGTGITTTNTLFQASTGTGAYGYAVIRSKRTVRYRPGQGALARFTAKFDEGRTGYTQRAGFFTQEQALQVGYNTDGKFGIVRINGGKAHIHKFAITTKAAGTENITVTLAGTATTVSIGAGTTTLDNAAGIGTQTFAGWTIDYRDNEVIFLSNTLGAKTGTFSMTSSGSLVATASTVQSGVVQTEHWTYQEDWNEDTLTGVGGTTNPSLVTLNQQKLNVFQINFRWLGAGEMRYAMENPSNGDLIFIHHDHYSNRNDDVHLDNPSMKIGYVAAELGGNAGLGVTIKGASMLGAIEGVISPIDYPLAAYHSRTTNISANTLTHLLSVKNNLINDGKINSRELIIKQITCGAVSASAAPCLLYLYVSPIYGATPTYTSIGSASAYSTTDTTITGTPIAVFAVTTGSPTTIDLSDLRIALPPTTKLAMAISCTSLLTRVDAGITFIED